MPWGRQVGWIPRVVLLLCGVAGAVWFIWLSVKWGRLDDRWDRLRPQQSKKYKWSQVSVGYSHSVLLNWAHSGECLQDCFLLYLLSSSFIIRMWAAFFSSLVLLLCLLSSPFLAARAADLFCSEKLHQLKTFEAISRLTIATCISA